MSPLKETFHNTFSYVFEKSLQESTNPPEGVFTAGHPSMYKNGSVSGIIETGRPDVAGSDDGPRVGPTAQ